MAASQSFALQHADLTAPLANPLPEGPDGNYFNEAQWTMMMSIMDAVIPSIRQETATTDERSNVLSLPDVEYNTAVDRIKKTIVDPSNSGVLDEYFRERPSENPRFQEMLKRTLNMFTKDDVKRGLAFILSALKYVRKNSIHVIFST